MEKQKREKNGGKNKKKREKTDENSGHYVMASSRPPDRWNAARSCQFSKVFFPHYQVYKTYNKFLSNNIKFLTIWQKTDSIL